MRARSGSSTRWLGTVSVLTAGSACLSTEPCADPPALELPPQPDAGASDPPTVIAGQWIGPGVLELSFSKPLQTTAELDTARFAVVEWYSYRSCTDWATGYRELRIGYYAGTAIGDAWIGPEDDTLLRLRFINTGAQCRGRSDAVASGIMLVYTDVVDEDAGAGLLDEDGIPVPDLGPAWAVGALDTCMGNNYCRLSSYFTEETLPMISSLVPIPCP